VSAPLKAGVGGALAGVLVAWALSAGGWHLLPEAARVTLAFFVLVLWPGLGWARAIGVEPAGGRALALGWALGYGVAWLGLCVLVTRALALPFTVLAGGGALWAALPWLASAWLAPRANPGAPLARAAGIAVALAGALVLLHVARGGPPITYLSDSPDHVGTVRRMLEHGDAFPRDAYFRDAGTTGVDPRKGLWHPGVALVCALAHVDPLPAWHVLSALLAPFLVLTAAGFGFRLGGSLGAAAAAWGTLLGYGGGLSAPYLSEAVFATKLADQLALATAVALLTDLEQRSLRSRIAVAGLALATVFTHVFGALQFAITFGSLGLGLLVRDRAWTPALRRLAVTAAACALVAAPYVAWRGFQSAAAVDPIHTEPQGLLEILPGVRVVSVGAVWDWLGPLWLLFPASLLAWARSAREPAVLVLLTSTLAVGALMFLPPVVTILEPRLGYLLMRLPWLLPVGPAVAFLVVRARSAWGSGRRLGALAPAALLAVALGPGLADLAHAFEAPRVPGGPAASMARWADALAWIDRSLPRGSVVLADPATSYAIPAYTGRYVTCMADQHGSPADGQALRRILDARDALDPYASWSRTADVVKKTGATAIALNGRIGDGPGLDFWTASPTWYAAARARLERAPGAFERVFEHDRFSVYRVHPEAIASLPGGEEPRPFVRPAAPGDRGRPLGPGLPELVSFGLERGRAARGDTLAGVLAWRAPVALPPGSYRVGVRFDRALPADVPRAPRAISKLWRKLIERVRGERYRFRVDHLPVDGAYGVDRWSPGEVVLDSFRIAVPLDVASGTYTVKATMLRQPHYPNLRLQDITSDDDLLDGLAVGRLDVVAPGAR